MHVVVLAAFEAPLLFPTAGINCIEIRVPAADEERAVGQGRRSMDHVAGGKHPPQRSGLVIELVNIPTAAAEIDKTIRHQRQRQVDVEWIRHQLSDRLYAVKV